MKMQNFFKKQAVALVALAIAAGSYTLLSFSPSKKVDAPITFEYTPPTGDPNPYSKPNVEDLDNWKPLLLGGCASPGTDAACTIDAPLESTIDGDGLELDPSMVHLELSASSTGEFKVNSPVLSNPGYENPINRSIP